MNLTSPDSPRCQTTLFCSLLLNAALLFLFFLLFVPGFEENDDVCMMYMVNGKHAGKPISFLIFSHILIGKALGILYNLYAAFDWYSFYLYTSHFLAMTALCFTLLRRWRLPLGAVLFLFFWIFFELRFLILLQFTTTAGILTLSSAMLFLFPPEENLKKHDWEKAVAVDLLILATLIRVDSVLLIGLLALPLLLLALIQRTEKRQLLTYCAVALGIFLLFQTINLVAYKTNPEWEKGRRKMILRSEIMDSPIAGSLQTAANGNKLTEVDIQHFENWFFEDKDIWTQSNLENITRNAHKLGLHQRSCAKTWDCFRWGFLDEGRFILQITLILLIGSLILFIRGLQNYLTLAAIIIIMLALSAWLSCTAKFPARLALPMLFFLAVTTVFLIPATAAHTKWQRYGLVVLVLLALCPARQYLKSIRTIHFRNAERCKNLLALDNMMASIHSPGSPSPLFFAGAMDYPLVWVTPFADPSRPTPPEVIYSGWQTTLPLFDQSLQHHGIKNLYESLLTANGPNLVLHPDHLDNFIAFISEHHDTNITPIQIGFFKNPYYSSSPYHKEIHFYHLVSQKKVLEPKGTSE